MPTFIAIQLKQRYPQEHSFKLMQLITRIRVRTSLWNYTRFFEEANN